ncbi:2-dehydropantoate 2-reductase [Litchfieldia salsa]|uniref:2-dehydropantoate 2-reductase n=1 Tax=Litchfieldia salsa TaxID=930152 RepID=A0A1H0REV4_9BACI|nr:2-dehydropantoate 2-reductase [Litchfieldia salsa]SDP28152.1 2-dehydropantoate 2-reductase [Litchfieldia salsa]
MNIGIIGGGSIGLLFGYYLSTFHEVTIYTRNEMQANALRQGGIILEREGELKNRKVNSKSLTSGLLQHQVVIIAVKQYDLENLLIETEEELRTIPSLLFLQNGMSHLRLLDLLDNKTVGVGIVEHGAMKMSVTTVKHTGIGAVKISAYKGSVDDLISMFNYEEANMLNVRNEKSLQTSMNTKLVINAVINPLTALYRVENGWLLSNQFFIKTMQELFDEVISVISIQDKEQLWDLIVSICHNTANNRSSMLKDIDLGRETEVDSILGYILERAREQNKLLPVTSFLYSAVKGLEERRN